MDGVWPAASGLREVPVFDSLDARALVRLEAISEIMALSPRVELFRQGETPGGLHFLLQGQVILSGTAPDGSQAVIEVLTPGAAFVVASVLVDQPYLMSATTVTSARILKLRAAPLRALIRTEPQIAFALMGTLARNYRSMTRQVRDLKLRTATQRLACYLLSLMTDRDAKAARLRLPFHKALLAGRLGCRQDSLSRAFAVLREMGVETSGATIIVNDVPRLRTYAMPDELADEAA
jgi:CRP/FNR family transcriptional regulator, transcriptional activator FtrB